MTKAQPILLACSLFLLAACSGPTTTVEQTTTDSAAAVSGGADTATADQPATSSDATTISQFLKNTMPTWSVPESDTWEKYWYDRFNKDKNTVYRVQSDFDGTGGSDYAYILKDSSDKFAVWAFLHKGDTYAPYRIYDITRLPNRKLHVGLGVLQPGTYNDLNKSDTTLVKVRTEHPAIHVIFFETAAKAYYWKDSSFHLIQTGD